MQVYGVSAANIKAASYKKRKLAAVTFADYEEVEENKTANRITDINNTPSLDAILMLQSVDNKNEAIQDLQSLLNDAKEYQKQILLGENKIDILKQLKERVEKIRAEQPTTQIQEILTQLEIRIALELAKNK